MESIRSAILSHEFAPGQPLVEAELAAELGVSKTPVREALKILSSSGLVNFETYKGAQVAAVDLEFINSVYGLRLILEPVAARMSVENGADFEEAGVLLEESADASSLADLGLANQRFHSILYQGCGNPLMIEVLDNLRDRTSLISVWAWKLRPEKVGEWTRHVEVLKAARAGDGQRVYDLLHTHIVTSHEEIANLYLSQ